MAPTTRSATRAAARAALHDTAHKRSSHSGPRVEVISSRHEELALDPEALTQRLNRVSERTESPENQSEAEESARTSLVEEGYPEALTLTSHKTLTPKLVLHQWLRFRRYQLKVRSSRYSLSECKENARLGFIEENGPKAAKRFISNEETMTLLFERQKRTEQRQRSKSNFIEHCAAVQTALNDHKLKISLNLKRDSKRQDTRTNVTELVGYLYMNIEGNVISAEQFNQDISVCQDLASQVRDWLISQKKAREILGQTRNGKERRSSSRKQNPNH